MRFGRIHEDDCLQILFLECIVLYQNIMIKFFLRFRALEIVPFLSYLRSYTTLLNHLLPLVDFIVFDVVRLYRNVITLCPFLK